MKIELTIWCILGLVQVGTYSFRCPEWLSYSRGHSNHLYGIKLPKIKKSRGADFQLRGSRGQLLVKKSVNNP